MGGLPRAARVDLDGYLFLVTARNGTVGNGFRPLHSIMTIDIRDLSAFLRNLDGGRGPLPSLLAALAISVRRLKEKSVYNTLRSTGTRSRALAVDIAARDFSS